MKDFTTWLLLPISPCKREFSFDILWDRKYWPKFDQESGKSVKKTSNLLNDKYIWKSEQRRIRIISSSISKDGFFSWSQNQIHLFHIVFPDHWSLLHHHLIHPDPGSKMATKNRICRVRTHHPRARCLSDRSGLSGIRIFWRGFRIFSGYRRVRESWENQDRCLELNFFSMKWRKKILQKK